MSSKVARCIYGFTQAPISATVSVTSDAGTQSAATVVVNERNSWLSLGAYNFTYSSPTIRIKLTQDAVVDSPTPPSTTTPKIAIATPKKEIAVKKTITCIKGKTTKKITGVNSKCPKGFKKK
jgi:hypothetical protein